MEGIIIKGIGGFYYVETAEGIYECKARGLFRKQKTTPLAGDRCVIQTMPDMTGYVEEILPRKNSFIRPPVANVDLIYIVCAASSPEPMPLLIDKLSVVALKEGAEARIIINKMDLKTPETALLAEAYEKAGFRVYTISAETGEGVQAVKTDMMGKISVFAGCSGVGKSSILNRLFPEINQKTGNVSEKIKRGKHTTREVSLIKLPEGGYIADTPGFSELEMAELTHMEKEELFSYFPEIEKFSGDCSFRDCMHISEPGCGVKAAVEAGEISPIRYESYKEIYKQLGEINKWQKKSK
ncbi:MAG: ribosome small subunit-dependent GTPase A [Clostridia bacterium]|nr:ribosome small subunit-dependent GTPase A [Clostridia bacterium]